MTRTVWLTILILAVCAWAVSAVSAEKGSGGNSSGKSYSGDGDRTPGASGKDSGSKGDSSQNHGSKGGGSSSGGSSGGGSSTHGSSGGGSSNGGYSGGGSGGSQGQGSKGGGSQGYTYGDQSQHGNPRQQRWQGGDKPGGANDSNRTPGYLNPGSKPHNSGDDYPGRNDPQHRPGGWGNPGWGNDGPDYRWHDYDRNWGHNGWSFGLSTGWFWPQTYSYGGYGNGYYNGYTTPYDNNWDYYNPAYPNGPHLTGQIQGAEIWAADGAFLGVVSTNTSNYDSIANQSGPYGSFNSPTSILNPRSEYGMGRGPLSCWDPDNRTPPRLFLRDQFVGYLSTNPDLYPRTDPNWLVRRWLPSLRW
jgi:hypothetical protein